MAPPTTGGTATASDTPIRVPPGFHVEVIATGLGEPRALAFDVRGALLISLPRDGRVVGLPGSRPGTASGRLVTVATNLDRPHGIAFRASRLYVAESGRVLSFRYDPDTLTAHEPTVVVAGLPAGEHHWTRSIAFGPDGRLYVAVGSSCDVCRERDHRRAAIVRYQPDGSHEQVFARGLRNPVGLAFHPITGALWTTVNERDWRSGGAPPDLVTVVREGAHHGWPDCYASGGVLAPDPELRSGVSCRDFVLPSLELPPHSAPLGHAFHTGRRLPPAYRGNLFVALHGSRAGLPETGYKVVRAVFAGATLRGVEDFATGWRRGDAIWGRPVDVIEAPDGALMISDDHGGRILRISFRPDR
jgi:glucose/arabinose dehydrogenase